MPRLTLSKRSAFSAVKDVVLRPQTSSFLWIIYNLLKILYDETAFQSGVSKMHSYTDYTEAGICQFRDSYILKIGLGHD